MRDARTYHVFFSSSSKDERDFVSGFRFGFHAIKTLIVIGSLACICAGDSCFAQFEGTTAGESGSGLSQRPADGKIVADIQIVGNQGVAKQEIQGEIRTRVGQRFDSLQAQRDVRSLILTKKFFDVKVKTRSGPQPDSVVVIYEVFEFPKINYIHFIGNEDVSSRTLRRKIPIKKDDPLDPGAIEQAREKLEKYYKENGYNKVQVELREGFNRTDKGAVFFIHEGPKQVVWTVEFVGNTFISDGRLRQQIESAPSRFKYIPFMNRSYVDRQKLAEDDNRLTSYYRGFGYMLARVGHEVDFKPNGSTAHVRYVIDEGPRFRVRSVSFNGNHLFGDNQFEPLVKLKPGQHFDLATMQKDVQSLTDAYGSVGFILADIQPSPRILEAAPEVDLVYDIKEGDRYRVGRINVKIAGDSTHTRRTVALNRLSIRPGDIVDIRKVRDSERRIRASGLFLSDPTRGVRPKIVFREIDGDEAIAERSHGGSVYRGQSPDGDDGGAGGGDGEEVIEIFVYRERPAVPVPQHSLWRQP